MDHICQHSSREIQTEHVDLGNETFADKTDHPCNQLIVPIDTDDAVFYAALLQNGQTETLSNTAIVLFLENLNRD